MKHIFCKRLAACLCMQQSPSPSLECLLVNRMRSSAARGDGFNNDDDLKTPDVPATKNKTTEKRLVACVHVQSPYASSERPLVDKRRRSARRGDDFNNDDDLKATDVSATKNETADKAVHENRDLLEAEMKNDWMLAAAVLDRIFAIAFTIIYFGGTLVVAVIIATHA